MPGRINTLAREENQKAPATPAPTSRKRIQATILTLDMKTLNGPLFMIGHQGTPGEPRVLRAFLPPPIDLLAFFVYNALLSVREWVFLAFPCQMALLLSDCPPF